MADQYDEYDEATLQGMLAKAENYDERSSIRKALRKFKGGAKKQVGSSSYRRAGWQAPKSVAIPNSVTGNVLPNKVNVTENKVEVPTNKSTTSYLAGKETGGQRRKSSGAASTNALSPRGSTTASPRGSVSSYTSITPEPKELAEPAEAPEVINTEPSEDSKPRASGTVNVTVGRTPSPQPPAITTRVNENSRNVISPTSRYRRNRSPSPPPKEPSPEPPREPTPEPEREPTPEPPREPTPEPPREPTPEPSPSPEPEKEPTPEPVREPTPEPEPEEEEDEEEEGSEEDEYSEGDEYSDDDDREVSSEGKHQYRGGRSTYDPTRVGAKTSLPQDVLARKEDGIDGDFRRKLRKAGETKIDTTKAFPQAKPKGEQVDFRNVLRKSDGPQKKDIKTGSQAQSDFRGSLRGKPNRSPETKPKTRRLRKPEEEAPAQEESQEPQEETPAEPEPEQEVEQEVNEEVNEPEEQEEQEEEPQEQTPPPEAEPEEQVDAEPEQTPKEEDSFESRQAERRRRRAERMKEMDDMNASKSQEKPPVENGSVENGTSATDDSYEARREARRKAREDRLKAASAMVDDKPRLSYRERKALEAKKQMDNAKESRNKWANREEESGEKADAKPASFKKNTATQQLLAWCQHKTKFYENVEIKDFRQSWTDGMAFCAILHSFLPDKIPYDDLSPSNPRQNFTTAFEAAKDAGIPEMLDVDDMLSVKIPDSKSIMTFLVTIYQHFN